MKTPAMWMAAAAAVLFCLWMGWGIYVIVTTARPPYDVVRSLSTDVEIRQYREQTWISAVGATDGASFRVLASYIFGGNKESRRVAMTAPVITDERMSFILPADMSADQAPTPDGQKIAFSKVPSRRLATLQFSWWTSPARVESKTQELLAALKDHGIETRGRVLLMRYNDPWTPPFLRRNEVAVEVM